MNKKILIIAIVAIAIMAISTVSSVSAAYSLSDDGKRLSVDISSGTDKNTLNLGDGQKIHIETYFWYAKRMVTITTENTPKITDAYILGSDKYGMQYTASRYFVGGSGSFFTLNSSHVEYESFREGGTPYRAIIYFNKTLIKTKAPGNNLKPDLKITKITKNGNYRYVTIKNIGKNTAKANKLGVYISKNNIKLINVKALKKGESIKIKVLIPKKYKTKNKTFYVDIKNVVKESNEKNNSLKAK